MLCYTTPIINKYKQPNSKRRKKNYSHMKHYQQHNQIELPPANVTATHLLLECPKFSTQRAIVLNAIDTY